MPDNNGSSAPTAIYVPYKTFNAALDTLKEGIPPKIDRTVFRGQSGGTQAQLMSAFKALGVINEAGEPVQPTLSRLVDSATRKATLKALLLDKYADIVALHAANATERQLSEKLSEYNVSGATLSKAMGFFLRAADEVGIALSPHVTKKTKAGSDEGAPKRARRVRSKRPKPEETPPPTPPTAQTGGSKHTVELANGATVTLMLAAMDLITMSDHDRDWVVGAIKYFRDYKREAQAPKPEPARGSEPDKRPAGS